jgi:predicted RNA-binding Zn ribbon-like protein
MRETIHRIFSAHAAKRPQQRTDSVRFNRELSIALSHLQLTRAGERFVWAWDDPDGALESVLWAIIWSAAQLLVSPDLKRVRECAGVPCSWLFIDRSRNHSRRWCSMAYCGNRAKTRRHYERACAKRAGTN